MRSVTLGVVGVVWVPVLDCIALRYAECMTQLVARIDADLAKSIDQLVAEGVVESRSDAVRKGLHSADRTNPPPPYGRSDRLRLHAPSPE